MARVVVVGAGMGGLAAAARLAATGHRVTVCEQADEVGGKLGWYARDGFCFDTGPSLLTLPAVYRDLFLATGGPLEDAVDLVPLEPAFTYRFADGTRLTLPNNRAGVVRALDDTLGDGAGAQWQSMLQRASRIWDLTREPFLTSPLDGARTLARLARSFDDVRTVAPTTSLRALGRRYLRDPRLRVLLDRYATYTGSDPRRAPAALATVPFVEQAFGAWYVRGGLRRLGLAVHDRALECGASVRTRSDVTEVTLAGSRVDGVRLASGERLPADVVVANADAAHLYRDLLGRPRLAPPPRSASLSGFVLLLALRAEPGAPQPHHAVSFPADYDAEFDAVFAGRMVDEPAVYVSSPGDPELAPPGHEAWFVLVNAPRHDTTGRHGLDWTAAGRDQGYAERLLDVMADRGLDVRKRLLWYETRSPAWLEHRTRAVGGSIYGTSSNGARAAFLRPANRSPVPGLFLVGGSSHPGGGLPLVGLSAAIVADLIGRA